MRNMAPPPTPLPSAKSTGAEDAEGGAEGLALGEMDARVLGEGWSVAVAAVELTLRGAFDSQPPSYSTAARRTQAAAPRPTAIRIAVSGFRGVAGGAASLS